MLLASSSSPKRVKSSKKGDARSSPSAKSSVPYMRMFKNDDGTFEDFYSGFEGTDPHDVKGKVANRGSVIVSRYLRFKLMKPDTRKRTEAEIDALKSAVHQAAVEEAEHDADLGGGLISYWEYAYMFAGFECFVLE